VFVYRESAVELNPQGRKTDGQEEEGEPVRGYKREVITQATEDGVTAVIIARNYGWNVISVLEIVDEERTERLSLGVTLGKRVQILESLFRHCGDISEVTRSVSRSVDVVEAIRKTFWVIPEPKLAHPSQGRQSKR